MQTNAKSNAPKNKTAVLESELGNESELGSLLLIRDTG